MNRRTILKLLGAAGLPVSTDAVAQTDPTIDINDFLSRANPSELINYHGAALMEAMEEQRKLKGGIGGKWRFSVDMDNAFAIVVDDAWRRDRKARP